MGCDIHISIERKRTVNGQESWNSLNAYTKNEYFGDDGEREWDNLEVYNGRDYCLFSALAGVRDYSDNPKIDEPRGMPDNASQESKELSEGWGCDGHSHSYCTLREILEYKKNQPKVKHSGYVSPEAAEALDYGTSTPNSWCQGTSNKTWVHRAWEGETCVMDRLIDGIKRRCNDTYTIYDFVWDRDEDELLEQAESVRIIFWFDN